jgi:hypothetical protein
MYEIMLCKLVLRLIAEKLLKLKNLPEITHNNLSLDVWNEAIVHQGSPEDLPFLRVLYKGHVGHCFNHFSFVLYVLILWMYTWWWPFKGSKLVIWYNSKVVFNCDCCVTVVFLLTWF